MKELEASARLRACTDADEAFVYDVFATTWVDEVAALPNKELARHVLRIQHIAQERRFRSTYPHLDRFVVLEGEAPVGRLYVDEDPAVLQVVDLTLLPEHRGHGLGRQLLSDLTALAANDGRAVTLRVPRRNEHPSSLYGSLGFRLVERDDLDTFFEWTPRSMKEGEALVAQRSEAVDHSVRQWAGHR